jgi:hypothetical protein
MVDHTGKTQKIRLGLWVLLLLVLAGASVLLIKETTRFGAGLRPDSFSFLSAAENFVRGGGYGRPTWDGGFKPITGFPPMFSIAVAALHRTGLPAYPSARVLNGILFGSTILLAGAAVYFATRSIGFSVLGAGILLGSSVLIDVYSWAQSEPLYLFLSLLGLVLFAWYLTRPDQWIVFWAAILAISAAFLTRYAGIALVASGIVALFLVHDQSKRRRIRDLLVYVVIVGIPMVMFLGRNKVLTGTFTNRPSPFWHPPSAEKWYEALRIILAWIFPNEALESLSNGWLVLLFVLCASGIALVYGYSRTNFYEHKGDPEFRSSLISMIFIYLIFNIMLVLVTVFFLDILTPLNNRILVPIHLSALLILVLVLSMWWDTASITGKVIVGLISVTILFIQVRQAFDMYNRLRAEPQGYASNSYRSSPTIEYVRELPDIPIFTNDLPALYFWAQRIGVFIPNAYNASAKEVIDPLEYEQLLASMRKILDEYEGVLVIYGYDPRSRLTPEHFREITEGLTLIEEFNDGLVYILK